MHVEMRHFLMPIAAMVGKHAISAIDDAHLAGDETDGTDEGGLFRRARLSREIFH